MKATLPIPTVTQSFNLTRTLLGVNLLLAGDFFLCAKALDFFPKVDAAENIFRFKISNRRFKGAKKFVLQKENTTYYVPYFFWDENKDGTYQGIFFCDFEKTLTEITKGERYEEREEFSLVNVYVSIENIEK